jgi:hypothetical protein
LLQRTVYAEIGHLGKGAEPVWAGNRWTPHITLAEFSNGARVGEAVQHLLTQETVFELTVPEISVVEGDPKAAVIATAPFSA